MGDTYRDKNARGGRSDRRHGDSHVGGFREETTIERFDPVAGPQRSDVDSRPPYRPRPTEGTQKKGDTIASRRIEGEGKVFFLDAVVNSRGKCLIICEVSMGKRTRVVVPASMVEKMEVAIGELIAPLSAPPVGQ
jgi:hypothetical protein